MVEVQQQTPMQPIVQKAPGTVPATATNPAVPSSGGSSLKWWIIAILGLVIIIGAGWFFLNQSV